MKKNKLLLNSSFVFALIFGFLSPNFVLGQWSLKKTEFYAYPSQEPGTVPVYRLYHLENVDHFYTISESEKDKLVSDPSSGWHFEKTEFYAYPSQEPGTVPVYRFHHKTNKDHYYTIFKPRKTKNNPHLNKIRSIEPGGSLVDIDMNSSSLVLERIEFYAYPNQSPGTVPVYQFYRPDGKDHLYVASEAEKNYLLSPLLGPEITVGLWEFTRDDIRSDGFRIDANKDYIIKNHDGEIIGNVSGSETTEVEYAGDKQLRVEDTIPDTLSDKVVYFEAADGDNTTMIFDVHLPGYSYDEYRGKITLRYSDNSRNIWVINTLPLEHYVWGDGELAGTGDMDHNRVMVTSYRTYGYWWLLYATKYASEGFKVNATPGNQLYRGYEYEEAHPRVREAAEDTRGKIVKYDDEIAITPYSSWTDGRTRSFEERWGSDNYPWCQSVSDPYGKHPYLSTTELENAGNHMVGLSAHGSLNLAGDHGWSWDKIIKYYFDDVEIKSIY